MPLCPVDGAPSDQGQEERREAAVRGGGETLPEHDGEDVGDLEQQARERPVRVAKTFRTANSSKRYKSMKLVVTNHTDAGVERVLQVEDAQMPMWGDLGLTKEF